MGEENKVIRRIAVIGPESTGKSTLCNQLAGHFGSVWIPEFSREYISGLKTRYTLQDIEFCAREQIRLENENLNSSSRFIFSDTELILAKIWCEDVFHVCPLWIEEFIRSKPHDFYLLTTADIPWVKDAVRENENRRDHFFNLYKKELDEHMLPYSIISGSGKARLLSAINALNDMH